ncbi:C1 family peptidase [Fibrivirga algicola]|uniref:DUF4384 domain-containing protein n=1 Tax=Fibrivirga algicola TaxID=2950420 RepID=A0ABX0QIZ2_9BACT|nr:C1 family peptidase [Fibrivirga algicola]NID12106.1 DUF4384 domain-containing protein [Fibrivirga algicola]
MKPSTLTTRLLAIAILTTRLPLVQAQEKPIVRKYAGGLNMTQTRSLTVMTKARLTTRSLNNLPEQVSYEQFCPSVGDQGKQETSVAFATAYYLRTIMEGKELNVTQQAKLDQARFSPTFIYDKIRDPKDKNCQGGGTIEEALDVLKTAGVPRLKTLAYPLCSPSIPAAAAKEASQFRIGDYQQLFAEPTDPDQKVLAVKKALAEGNPVVVGIGAPLSFEEARAVWEPAPNEQVDDILYNQAICVVGYNDKLHGGAFRIVNSWTSKWGEKGFCWIPYAHFGRFTHNAFQVYGGVKTSVAVTGGKAIQDGNRRGSAELKLNDGTTMPIIKQQATRKLKVVSDESAPNDITLYQLAQNYPTNTRFKFYLNNSENAYVYALTTDEAGDFIKLFPFDELTSPLLGPNTTVAYPDETHSIVMEKRKSNDYLLILFSKRPLIIDALIKSLERKRGSLDKRLADILGDQLVRQDQVKYQTDQAAFEVKSGAPGNIVPLLIEFQYK